MTQTWYLGAREAPAGASAVLVGDPGRVRRFARCLDAVREVSRTRGFRTVSGRYRGAPVYVAAFGMGAPAAAVVMEELVQIGVARFLRCGTVMSTGAVPTGALAVGTAAVGYDGTSRDYLGVPGRRTAADSATVEAAAAVCAEHAFDARPVVLGSRDAFYGLLVGRGDVERERVAAWHRQQAARGIAAFDMESAAILAVAKVRGVRAASLCLVSVDGPTGRRLGPRSYRAGEERMVASGLGTLARLWADPPR